MCCNLTDKELQFYIAVSKGAETSGGGDCALFAIANTVAFCYEQDPHLVRYDQSQMKRHLCECYEGGKLTPFPEKKKNSGG